MAGLILATKRRTIKTERRAAQRRLAADRRLAQEQAERYRVRPDVPSREPEGVYRP